HDRQDQRAAGFGRGTRGNEGIPRQAPRGVDESLTVNEPRPIKRLLIANRGEIAVRVIHACRTLGISPVAVYSEADAGSLHVRLADESVLLGPAPARESYLSTEKVLGAAAATGCDAVHPGF